MAYEIRFATTTQPPKGAALSLHPAFRRIIRRARAEAKRGKVYSLAQIKAEFLTETEAPAAHEQPTRAAKPSSARKKHSPRRR